jgi:uncharacterized membrane protein
LVVQTICGLQFAKVTENQIKGRVFEMLWTIIVIVFVLWLLGAFGGKVFSGFPKTGNWVHILIVIAVLLLILKLLGVI